MEKEIKVKDDSERIEKLLSFIVMKRLITPIKKSEAYKLGLVDRTGKISKKPETEEEKKALSTFDVLIFKLKRLLGSKLAQLNSFMYVQSSEEDLSNSIKVMGGVEKRGMVKRVIDDMDKLLEKYDVTDYELYNNILREELNKKGM